MDIDVKADNNAFSLKPKGKKGMERMGRAPNF